MTTGTDPLGKRALFWMPVDADDDQMPVDRRAPAHSGGKRALFTPPDPVHAASAGRRTGPQFEPGRGNLRVACSSCAAVSRIGFVEFVALQLPIAAWLPRREFDRWMRCPACRSRTWLSVTFAR